MFDELQAALADVQAKKAVLDAASDEVKLASAAYQAALAIAQQLHQDVSVQIAGILPNSHTRIA